MQRGIINQQDREAKNARELGYIADFIFERTQSSDEISAVMTDTTAFLHAKQLMLDVDDHTLKLKGLLFDLICDHKTDTLNQVLEAWAEEYPAAFERANQQGEQNRIRHGSQPHGIYRGIKEKGLINYQAWGEDLDILVTLRNVITTHPDQITSSGVYILPPVSAENQADILDRVREVQTLHPEKSLLILIPINRGNNHWQLGKWSLESGKVKSEVWDSIEKGVQKNSYSCMDYVVREALKIKYEGQAIAQDLQVIKDAEGALEIREAIVNRILNVHESVQDNESLQQSVRNQMSSRGDVESFLNIADDDEEGLHTELLKNKDIQEAFDASMATMLDELYKSDKNTNEAQQFVIARKFAYQELLKKYGFFRDTSEKDDSAILKPTEKRL